MRERIPEASFLIATFLAAMLLGCGGGGDPAAAGGSGGTSDGGGSGGQAGAIAGHSGGGSGGQAGATGGQTGGGPGGAGGLPSRGFVIRGSLLRVAFATTDEDAGAASHDAGVAPDAGAVDAATSLGDAGAAVDGGVVADAAPTDASPSDTATAPSDGAPDLPPPVLGGKSVTHVMAVNPSSSAFDQIVVPVAGDGSFVLDVDPAVPWVLVFLDSARVGPDMIAGIFKAAALDTVAPMGPGNADLGTVEITDGGAVDVSLGYQQLLEALGLSAITAETLGSIDDLCLRYVNPDVDGDGVIDAFQSNRRFLLDLHADIRMVPAGQDLTATVADITDAFLPDTTVPRYGGTGIYAVYPTAFAAPTADNIWASFDQPLYYAGPNGSGLAEAGTVIPGASLVLSSFGESGMHGPIAVAGHDLPQGTYRFGVADQTLTFTNVQTHTAAELQAAENLIAPFVRIRRVEGCTGDCAIAGFDYQWKKHTAGGWVDATLDELRLIVSGAGGMLSINKAYDNGPERALLVIPATSVSGSLDWSVVQAENSTAESVAAMTTAQVCHVGLSFDDKLGTRFFSTIANAPGTCPMRQ